MEGHTNQELAFDSVKREDSPRLRRLLTDGYDLEKHVLDVGVALLGRPNQRCLVKPVQIGDAISQINWRIYGDVPLKFDQRGIIGRRLRRKEQQLEPAHGVAHNYP